MMASMAGTLFSGAASSIPAALFNLFTRLCRRYFVSSAVNVCVNVESFQLVGGNELLIDWPPFITGRS